MNSVRDRLRSLYRRLGDQYQPKLGSVVAFEVVLSSGLIEN